MSISLCGTADAVLRLASHLKVTCKFNEKLFNLIAINAINAIKSMAIALIQLIASSAKVCSSLSVHRLSSGVGKMKLKKRVDKKVSNFESNRI